jgi:hypothetical protein
MDIEVLDLKTLKWSILDYSMAPPRYGFSLMKVGKTKAAILGGRRLNEKDRSIVTLDFNFKANNRRDQTDGFSKFIADPKDNKSESKGIFLDYV